MLNYITPKGLENAVAHKYDYKTVDLSLTTRFLTPFWVGSVNLLPMWVAPNFITAIGFIQIVFFWFLTMYYAPTLTESLPTWLIICNGISLFMRQTLDAMDGKQARRTGASSPLGELLDHGVCDAIEILFISYICGALCQLGNTPLFFFFTMGGMTSHFCEMWATYLTGEIEFWYFSFTESEDVAVITHLVIAYVGQQVCQALVPGTNLRYVVLLFYITLIQFGLALFGAPKRIWGWLQRPENKIRAATETTEIFSYLIPGLFINVCAGIWYLRSPSIIHQHNIPFVTACSCLIANASCRLVTSRVCKERPSTYYNISLGLLFGIANAGGVFVDEKLFVWVYCFICIAAYAHYSYCVCMDFKRVLKVNIFSIKPKQ